MYAGLGDRNPFKKLPYTKTTRFAGLVRKLSVRFPTLKPKKSVRLREKLAWPGLLSLRGLFSRFFQWSGTGPD